MLQTSAHRALSATVNQETLRLTAAPPVKVDPHVPMEVSPVGPVLSTVSAISRLKIASAVAVAEELLGPRVPMVLSLAGPALSAVSAIVRLKIALMVAVAEEPLALHVLMVASQAEPALLTINATFKLKIV